MKRGSILFTLGLIVLIAMGAYTGFIYVENTKVADETKRFDKLLTDHRAEVMRYEDEGIETAIAAKQKLDDLKMETIEWSKIMRAIRRTLPTNRGEALVEILSYSGAEGNDIAMSVKTIAGSRDPYFDVAELIRAFDDSDEFVGSFVPSIAGSSDEDGNEILSLNITTRFVGVDVVDLLAPAKVVEEESGLEEAIGDILKESLETGEGDDAEPILR